MKNFKELLISLLKSSDLKFNQHGNINARKNIVNFNYNNTYAISIDRYYKRTKLKRHWNTGKIIKIPGYLSFCIVFNNYTIEPWQLYSQYFKIYDCELTAKNRPKKNGIRYKSIEELYNELQTCKIYDDVYLDLNKILIDII